MQVRVLVDHQWREEEIHPGTLLSEFLQVQGPVLLDMGLVEPERMLAAQAHQRSVLTQVQLPPAFEVLSPSPEVALCCYGLLETRAEDELWQLTLEALGEEPAHYLKAREESLFVAS